MEEIWNTRSSFKDASPPTLANLMNWYFAFRLKYIVPAYLLPLLRGPSYWTCFRTIRVGLIPFWSPPPSHVLQWCRYVDDIFCVLDGPNSSRTSLPSSTVCTLPISRSPSKITATRTISTASRPPLMLLHMSRHYGRLPQTGRLPLFYHQISFCPPHNSNFQQNSYDK